MWLGWRRLISNKIYNIAVHRILFRRMCVRILTFFCKLCIWQLQCNSLSVYRPHKPTVYPRSIQAQCSVSVTASTDTWRKLNIFIEVLCPAVHSWLLTAALLWCWKVTSWALCWICAGVDRYGATERGEMSVVFRHCINFQTTQELSRLQVHQPLQQLHQIHCRPAPKSASTSPSNPKEAPNFPPAPCGSGALLPKSERKFKYVILYEVRFTVFVLRAGIRAEVTKNCEERYKNYWKSWTSFVLLPIVSKQQVALLKKENNTEVCFTQIWNKDLVWGIFVMVGEIRIKYSVTRCGGILWCRRADRGRFL